MIKRSVFPVFFFVFLFSQSVFAASVIEGVVIDKESKETLPAANITIEGTYQGTITNSDGRFSLQVNSYPVTLVVRYIGFLTTKITISKTPNDPITISLTPTAYQFENVDVGEEDPAVYIMKQVIDYKKVWQAKLKTFKAQAYTRFSISNDSNIVSIMESHSKAYWDVKKGMRSKVLAQKQTNNLMGNDGFSGLDFMPNFYDDNIDIAGFNVVGITNPKAIDVYDFKLIKYRKLDDKIVFDISVKPKNKLETAFIGTISIIDEDYALLEVDLKPSESMIFPIPIRDFKLHFKQQYNFYGNQFWLPMDVRISGSISVGITGLMFPGIRINQVTRLSDYEVNTSIADSIFITKYQRISANDSIDVNKYIKKPIVNNDSLFKTYAVAVPLNEKEEQAYEKIDENMSMEKAFKPKGFLARFVNAEIENDEKESRERRKAARARKDTTAKSKAYLDSLRNAPKSINFSNYIEPEGWYTRVEGLHAGAKLFYKFNPKFQIEARGGYKVSSKNWGYGSSVSYSNKKLKNFKSKLYFDDDTQTRFESLYYNRYVSSAAFVLSGRDYYDYYWRRAIGLDAEIKLRAKNWVNYKVQLGLRTEKSRSLPSIEEFNLFSLNHPSRPNPSVFNGTINSVKARLEIGEELIPVAVVSQNRSSFTVIHSNSALFQSDATFTTFGMELDYAIPTFFKRRIQPNALLLKVIAATSIGDVPMQNLHAIDGSMGVYTPFGTLRTLPYSFYQGEHTAALIWEHNFGTVPLELLGLYGIAKSGITIILTGGHAKTWLSDSKKVALAPFTHEASGMHHEIGLSINGLFDILRLDMNMRLDRPGFYVGLSTARFFINMD